MPNAQAVQARLTNEIGPQYGHGVSCSDRTFYVIAKFNNIFLSRDESYEIVERLCISNESQSFDLSPDLDSISSASLFAHSLMIFRWIFPLASFGTSGMNTTPPVNHLCFATRDLIHSWISFSEIFPATSSFLVMYARGDSWPWLEYSESPFELKTKVSLHCDAHHSRIRNIIVPQKSSLQFCRRYL